MRSASTQDFLDTLLTFYMYCDFDFDARAEAVRKAVLCKLKRTPRSIPNLLRIISSIGIPQRNSLTRLLQRQTLDAVH